MSGDHAFAVLLVAIGLLASLVGWYGSRLVKRWDAMQNHLQEIVATRPFWIERVQRSEASIVKLSETTASLGVMQARLEGEVARMGVQQVETQQRLDAFMDVLQRSITRGEPNE